jgi:hypothetical protein
MSHPSRLPTFYQREEIRLKGKADKEMLRYWLHTSQAINQDHDFLTAALELLFAY